MATILIVDDQPHNREYLVTLLGYVGHTLIEASDGAEALAITHSAQPDLVIADLLMPTMDGYELVRQLRADPASAQIQVIYYTAAYLENEAHRLAASVGVEYILVKPADPEAILNIVGAALAQPVRARVSGATSPPSENFDRAHIRLLTDKRANKVDQLSVVNGRLAALLDLSQRLATMYDPADLLQTCCDAARSIIGAHQAVIQLFNDEGQTTRYVEARSVDASATIQANMQQLDPDLLAQLRAADQPVRRRDVGADAPNIGSASERRQGGAFLGVPIASATQRYGVLYLTNKLTGAEFDADDEQIAMTLAAQTAMAYENAQRYDALRNHAQAIEQEMAERAKAENRLWLYTRRLETLHVIDRAILAAQSPQEIAQAALHPIRQLVPSQHASILGFDLAAGEAEVWATGSDLPSALQPGGRFRLDELLSIDTIQGGQPFVMQDLRELANPPLLHTQLLKEGMRTYISVPIIVQNDLIGCLNIAADQPGALAAEYADIAQEVAAQLAMAIQNLRLFEQVRVGRERLQRLSQQLVQTQESERRHIARELHDEIGQSLTAAQLNLQVLVGISDLAELPGRLEDSMELIDRVLQQVRALSLDLRPSMLDDLGLAPALRWYINRQAERAAFKVDFRIEHTLGRLPADLETTCFRIAQEAINNIVRYAQAAHVLVELRTQEDILWLTISDDGSGFDVEAALQRAAIGQSLGLVSMQERAALLGGIIHFDSTPDHGTTIDMRLPLVVSTDTARKIERRSSAR